MKMDSLVPRNRQNAVKNGAVSGTNAETEETVDAVKADSVAENVEIADAAKVDSVAENVEIPDAVETDPVVENVEIPDAAKADPVAVSVGTADAAAVLADIEETDPLPTIKRENGWILLREGVRSL